MLTIVVCSNFYKSEFFSSDNYIHECFFLNLTIDYTKKNWHMILLLYTAYLHDYCNISLRCAILHCKFYLAPAWINEKIVILIDWLSKIQISNFIEYQLFFILIVSCKIWRKYCLYTSWILDQKKFDRIFIIFYIWIIFYI